MYLGARGVDVDLVIYRLEDKPVMGERRNSLLPRRVADYERHMSLVRRLSTYEAMKTDLEKSTSDVDKGRALMLDFVIEDLKMLLK